MKNAPDIEPDPPPVPGASPSATRRTDRGWAPLRHSITSRVKRLLFGDRPRVFAVRFGIGRGLLLYTDPAWNSQRIMGIAEAEVARDFRKLARKCGRYVELGASDGYYCAVVRRENPSADIIAFESQEVFAGIARGNLERNGLSLEHFDWRSELGGVSSSPLSELIDRGKVMFIKIDIEGGESEALRSAGAKWSDFKGGLLIEVHSPQLKFDCLAVLEKNGFSCRCVRQAWWRRCLPELRSLELNEWLIATKSLGDG